jgi:hypothetical protein
MKIFNLLVFLFFTAIYATAQNNERSASGILYRGVPEAADGCGPVFVMDSTEYRVTDVPEKFLTGEGLRVKLTFIAADTFYCGRGRAPIPSLKALSVKPVSGFRCKSTAKKKKK